MTALRSVTSTSTFAILENGTPPGAYPDIVLAANLPYATDPRNNTEFVLPGTKAVITLGPNCSDNETLRHLIGAGVTGFRINWSHTSKGDETTLLNQLEIVLRLRFLANEMRREVSVISDMKGPEFRTQADANIPIQKGDTVRITTAPGKSRKEGSVVHLHLEGPEGYNLQRDLRAHNEEIFREQVPHFVYIDDAQVIIRLNDWDNLFDSTTGEILGTIETGKCIENNKGTNFPGLMLPNLPVLTSADNWVLSHIFDPVFVEQGWRQLFGGQDQIVSFIEKASQAKLFHLLGFDFVAPSFVRVPTDVLAFQFTCRSLLAKHVRFIPKIETVEALKNLRTILTSEDGDMCGVMVARGDLAAQAGRMAVPHAQTRIVNMARQLGLFSIVATDVLGSMTEGTPFPTRAEMDGLFRIMEDGASAFMLSGESAKGKDPAGIATFGLRAFADPDIEGIQHTLDIRASQRENASDAVERELRRTAQRSAQDIGARAQAQIYLDQMRAMLGDATTRNVDGLVLWSKRGQSARLAAQVLPDMRVYVVTDNPRVARAGLLGRNIFPILVAEKPRDGNHLIEIVRQTIRVPSGAKHLVRVMHNLGNGA